MSRWLLGLMLAVSFAKAVAAPTKFKVESALGDRYALAWGMKGQDLDFEELARDQERAQKFLDENQDRLVNYLVDVKTGEVILTLLDPAFSAHLGEEAHIFHNHDWWNIRSLNVRSLNRPAPTQVSAFVISSGGKWDGGVNTLILLQRKSDGGNKTFSWSDLQARVETALVSRLTKKERLLFEKMKSRANSPALTNTPGAPVSNFSNTYYVPKSDAPGFTLEGNLIIQVDLKRGNYSVIVQGRPTFKMDAH